MDTHEIMMQIRSLTARGWDPTDISAELGISPGQVYDHLARLNSMRMAQCTLVNGVHQAKPQQRVELNYAPAPVYPWESPKSQPVPQRAFERARLTLKEGSFQPAPRYSFET